MDNQQKVEQAAYSIRVWTRQSYDQQVYKWYDKNKVLIGLNFHHGTAEIDCTYMKPDQTVMHIYKKLVLRRKDAGKAFNEKKCIQKAIKIWLKYCCDDCAAEDYAKLMNTSINV